MSVEMYQVNLYPSDREVIKRIIDWLNRPENGGDASEPWTEENASTIVAIALRELERMIRRENGERDRLPKHVGL